MKYKHVWLQFDKSRILKHYSDALSELNLEESVSILQIVSKLEAKGYEMCGIDHYGGYIQFWFKKKVSR